ncbi:uncharacterized protein M6B38_341425 [Iris pallida]|uniref:Uncharacterized protein n=1 Tax=Iris pallida TaxID=29817 RepID=A0AAX6GXH3_IRIPA|nr:uncharacterized protein M6B38_341425 [Iris pallida]
MTNSFTVSVSTGRHGRPNDHNPITNTYLTSPSKPEPSPRLGAATNPSRRKLPSNDVRSSSAVAPYVFRRRSRRRDPRLAAPAAVNEIRRAPFASSADVHRFVSGSCAAYLPNCLEHRRRDHQIPPSPSSARRLHIWMRRRLGRRPARHESRPSPRRAKLSSRIWRASLGGSVADVPWDLSPLTILRRRRPRAPRPASPSSQCFPRPVVLSPVPDLLHSLVDLQIDLRLSSFPLLRPEQPPRFALADLQIQPRRLIRAPPCVPVAARSSASLTGRGSAQSSL